MKNVTYYSASAGSGKTYSLTHKLAELIADGINPSEVILTTFSKIAATDFKERARGMLYTEGQFDKAALLDQATIGTVHAMAEKFIRHYWYFLGVSPQMKVMDEDGVDFYVSQSLAILPTDEDLKLFRKFRHTFDLTHTEAGINEQPYTNFWKDWLKSIIEKKTSYSIENMKASADYSLGLLKTIFNPSIDFDFTPDRFYDVLRCIMDVASTETTDKAKRRMKTAKSLLSKSNWTINDFTELLALLKGCTKKYNLSGKDILIAELCEIWHSNNVYDLISSVVKRLFELADLWSVEYALYKKERHIIDFNDMERYMLLLLTDVKVKDAVQHEIRSRYKVLMVDEFQDCNPIQVKIFNELSNLIEQTFWCGDSKQAIYGFRGTDTQLTEAVVGMIPEKKVIPLDTSYRSEAKLVEFCNSIFTRVFKDKIPEDKIRLKIYKKNQTTNNLIHWSSSAKNKPGFTASMAEHIYDFIKRNHLLYKDVAVLARNNNELDALSEALRKYHIPVNRGTGSLLAQKETELVISILALIVDDRNTLAKAKIAYLTQREGTWFDKPIQKLIDDRLKYINELEDGKDDLWLNDTSLVYNVLKRRSLWREQNVSSLIETVIVELNLRAITRAWGDSEIRERNLTQLISLAKTYERYCDTMMLGATTTGFLDYLYQRQDTAAGNKSGVTLLTYHGAKGLDWGNVILLSLGDDALNEQKFMSRSVWGVQYVRSTPPTKDNLFPDTFVSLLPWVWGTKGNLPETLANTVHSLDIYKVTRQAVLDESARLLYVGMTRPCNRIITTSYTTACPFRWLENLGITVNHIPEEGSMDLFGTGCLSVIEKPLYTNLDKEVEDKVSEEGVCVCPDSISRHFTDNAYFPKYISPSDPLSLVWAEVGNPIEVSKRFAIKGKPEMNKVGDCIHNIYAAYRGETETDQTMAQTLVDSFGYSKVLPDVESIIQTRALLDDYLTKHHGEKVHEYHELPFQHQIDGHIVRGSMDLVWETNEGCVLIDFKTFPGAIDTITDSTTPHYSGQYGSQFAYYRDTLVKSGKKVLQCYVFYPISGLLVPIAIT